MNLIRRTPRLIGIVILIFGFVALSICSKSIWNYIWYDSIAIYKFDDSDFEAELFAERSYYFQMALHYKIRKGGKEIYPLRASLVWFEDPLECTPDKFEPRSSNDRSKIALFYVPEERCVFLFDIAKEKVVEQTKEQLMLFQSRSRDEAQQKVQEMTRNGEKPR